MLNESSKLEWSRSLKIIQKCLIQKIAKKFEKYQKMSHKKIAKKNNNNKKMKIVTKKIEKNVSFLHGKTVPPKIFFLLRQKCFRERLYPPRVVFTQERRLVSK